MKISVLGTGDVGRTLSSAYVKKGHEVTIGTRNTEEKLAEQSTHDRYVSFSEWYKENKEIKLVTFSESASQGEIVINATNGVNSLNALDLAGEENLSGKILIDISNPLEYSNGKMSLVEGLNNTNSLGEEIQKEFPEAKVVKTFNTMWCGLMVNPTLIKGDHINYISGNDSDAKEKVKNLIRQFGWKDENIIDLGDISAARAQESVLLIWARLWTIMKTGAFNFTIAR
jgi:predicted dinucleotide-binding enzyme